MEQKRIAVVFHSVCGNTYLMAKEYAADFQKLGAQVKFYRLHDPNYEAVSQSFASAREFRNEILQIEVLPSPSVIMDCEAIFLGSPTYFGNMSGPVKMFMDSFVNDWVEGKLAGKFFGCFANSGTPQGGSDLCLQSMNIFAQHMGMVLLPVPNILKGAVQPAYGIAHYAGDYADVRLNEKEKESIAGYCAYAYSIMKG